MGSRGDGDGNDEIEPFRTASSVDISETETQKFDSQCSPPPPLYGGDADKFQFMQNTVPFDDTVPLEDAFETQLVNLEGETQILDDPNCVEHISTQVMDEIDDNMVIDSEGEETDRTEVLGDSDVLSDDDSGRKFGNHSVGGETMLHDHPCKQSEKEFTEVPDALYDHDLKNKNVLHDKPNNSGFVRGGFTYIRAASFRANGLAARAMALKKTNNGSCSILSDDLSSKQCGVDNNGIPVVRDPSEVGGKVNQDLDQGNFKETINGLKNENKGRIACSAVRKLFTEYAFTENDRSNGNVNDSDVGANLPQMLVYDNELAGLSYVDSQEPGELSQANALDFVDNFIKINVVELDCEVRKGRSSGGKESLVSSAKGSQSLAKKASHRSTFEETGTFDWDNSREDEGGGDLFCKKKKEFFDNIGPGQKYFTQARKPRHVALKGSRVDKLRNKDEQPNIHNKIMHVVHSDSKVMLHSLKMNGKTPETGVKICRNLINELDEQLKLEASKGRLEADGTDDAVPDMLNVGFDTQLAAEAMEALRHEADLVNHDANNVHQGMQNISKGSLKGSVELEANKRVHPKQASLSKWARTSDTGVITRQSKKVKEMGANLSKEFSILPQKGSRKGRQQLDKGPLKSNQKRAKLSADKHVAIHRNENLNEMPSYIIQQRNVNGASKRVHLDETNRSDSTATLSGHLSVEIQHKQPGTSTPIACRTRRSTVLNLLEKTEDPSNNSQKKYSLREISSSGQRSSRGVDDIEVSTAKIKTFTLSSNQVRDDGNVEKTELQQLDPRLTGMFTGAKVEALSYPRSYPRGRRTRRSLRVPENGTGGMSGSSGLSAVQEGNGQSMTEHRTIRTDVQIKYIQSNMKMRTRSSACACPEMSSIDRSTEVGLEGDASTNCKSADKDGVTNSKCRKGVLFSRADKNASLDLSSRETCKSSDLACTTPVGCTTPVNEASPICVGNEYFKQSCKKNLSRSFLLKEINSPTAASPKSTFAIKSSRRRRDRTSVRVLFSHHLDDDIVKKQKKILARLGVPIASSISDATHFVTDEFVRTRNMLEAIALGKPVVTHLWLESCGQASCFIDEKNYILRDAKKEKDLGFSMPVSLAHACQRPLLQGRRVYITPNTMPGKEIIASLVKAVCGLALERICRSALKDDKFADDLLVLSCEEDYSICVPFLEKGAAVYSSELLLNGIVIQKLEYERHQLFVDHVKRTRSAIWLRKDGDQFVSVANHT